MVRFYCFLISLVLFSTSIIANPIIPKNLFNSVNSFGFDSIKSPQLDTIILETKYNLDTIKYEEIHLSKDTIYEKKSYQNKSDWKHFRIYLGFADDSLYITNELNDWIFLRKGKYIDVDISSENPQNHIITFNYIDSYNSIPQEQEWNKFSEITRKKLIEWNGSNKINLGNDSWKRFKINANIEDDSVFIFLQDELGIFPPEKKYVINVDIADENINNQTIWIGAKAYPWKILSENIKIGLMTSDENNKEYLGSNKQIVKNNYSSVFTEAMKMIILKPIKIISPVSHEFSVSPTLYYVNPYFSVFGGKKLGIPIKRSMGFLFGLGNKYSGPFESDQVSFGFSLSGLSVNYMTRLNGVNEHINFPDSTFPHHFNNLYGPPNAWEINLAFPFGSFLEFGAIIPFGDNLSGGPPNKKYYENNDSSKELGNNIIDGKCFNVEFRYPFRFFESSISEVYLAYYAKEIQTGIYSRDSKLFKLFRQYIVSDLRLNFTITEERSFQMLFEWLISGISDNFKSFAIGPSVRLSKNSNGKFGVHTLLLNARVKIGDFQF